MIYISGVTWNKLMIALCFQEELVNRNVGPCYFSVFLSVCLSLSIYCPDIT